VSKAKDIDNPEWTRDMFRKARPAKEAFAHLDLPKPKGRGPQKTPTKVQTTIRLDRDVLSHFKRGGRGWQSRINKTLRKALPAQRRKRA
jgi:uncharacterized protein (DUF4415 family)